MNFFKVFPEDASSVGHHIDSIFYMAFWLTSVTFALVVGLMIYFLLKYRAREGHKAYYTHGNSPKAIALTLALAMVVFFAIDVNLAIKDHHVWNDTWGLSPMGDVVRIEIQPQQFAWNIRYAGPDRKFRTEDDVTTVNQLHVPINKDVIIALKSKDVIHSFFLPNFRIKQDAIPGLITSLFFKAVKKGEFDIACAEHCGLGHYRMRGVMTVESEEDFNAWLVKKGEKAPDLSWGWKWGEVLG